MRNFVLGSARVKPYQLGFAVMVDLREQISFVRNAKHMEKDTYDGEWKVTRDEDLNLTDRVKGFYFKEEETASRVAKAIDHAAQLCGATKDPF
jgi:hypothetical protein